MRIQKKISYLTFVITIKIYHISTFIIMWVCIKECFKSTSKKEREHSFKTIE